MQEALREPEETLLCRVRAAVHARLSVARPTKAWIARTLGMSTRTFQRRLAEHGTTWEQVLQDARARRSFELLSHPGVGTYDVAIAAGYRGSASFFRAFRAWTGTTPAAYRARQLSR